MYLIRATRGLHSENMVGEEGVSCPSACAASRRRLGVFIVGAALG